LSRYPHVRDIIIIINGSGDGGGGGRNNIVVVVAAGVETMKMPSKIVGGVPLRSVIFPSRRLKPSSSSAHITTCP
jgi:hypothetical protein